MIPLLHVNQPPGDSCCETVGEDFCANSVVFAGKAQPGNQCQLVGISHSCTELKKSHILLHCHPVQWRNLQIDWNIIMRGIG